jgi:hypothetical protein
MARLTDFHRQQSRHSWRSSTSSSTPKKRWSTSLTLTTRKMQALPMPSGNPVRSSTSDLQRCSWQMVADLRRSTSKSSMRCWTTPSHFMKGEPTPFASANSSRGRSAHPKTRSDPEAMVIGHPRVATTTTVGTTDVATETMIAVTIGDVIISSQETVVTSATCLPHRRQANPMARSSRPRGRST